MSIRPLLYRIVATQPLNRLMIERAKNGMTVDSRLNDFVAGQSCRLLPATIRSAHPLLCSQPSRTHAFPKGWGWNAGDRAMV
jgi:hypothetical protein